ncbi:MAG: hypothetical protein P4L93_02840, partial [Coriobacteriia bacterium]|nr:hypothetical protein [Coriobacteriia bacterium]
MLPFVEFSANRIVNGQSLSLFASAGWAWGGALLATLLLTLAAAFAPQRWRGLAVLVAAIAAFGALLFASGAAAVRLTPSGDTAARVSVGAGAWLVLAGVGIAWFQGARAAGSHRASVGAAFAAVALLLGVGFFGGLNCTSIAIEYRNYDGFWLLAWRHVWL